MKELATKPKALYPFNPLVQVHDDESWKTLNDHFELVWCSCETEEEFMRKITDPEDEFSKVDAICRSFWLKDLPAYHGKLWTKENLSRLPKQLKIIVQAGHGFDKIDLDYMTKRGIMFCNSPTATVATADTGVYLILAAFRQFTRSEHLARVENWGPSSELGYVGEDPNGKNLGIIGLGEIGFRVAKIAKALGMNILYNTRTQKHDLEDQVPGMKYYADLKEMLAETDCLFIVCPLTKETHHLINKETFKHMKEKVRLVNIGRGAIVEEAAVIDALERGQLVGAGFDVHEFEPKVSSKLLSNYNITLLPHNGASSRDSLKAFEKRCVDNLMEYFYGDGKPLCVNTELLD